MDDLLIGSVSSAGVCRLFKSLDTDGRHKILYPQHLIRKCLIDQSSICKCREYTVRIPLYFQRIFAVEPVKPVQKFS